MEKIFPSNTKQGSLVKTIPSILCTVKLFWSKYKYGVGHSQFALWNLSAVFYQKTNIKFVWSFLSNFTFQPWGSFYLSFSVYLFCSLFSNYHLRRELGVNSTIKCFMIGIEIEYRFAVEVIHCSTVPSTITTVCDFFHPILVNDLFLIWKRKFLRNKPKLTPNLFINTKKFHFPELETL